MGPTASGKSAIAEAVADLFGAQLINADAFQMYRGLDVGTAKPRNREAYRLLDVLEPYESFTAGAWVKSCHEVLAESAATGKSAVVVGGTGFYIRALTEAYDQMRGPVDPEVRAALHQRSLEDLVAELLRSDPGAAGTTDLQNPARVIRAIERTLSAAAEPPPPIPYATVVKVGVTLPTEELDRRILLRTNDMLISGWEQEVRDLLNRGIHADAPGMRAIGYRQIANFLEGKVPEEDLAPEIILKTRHYAKRQRTWLRSEPRLAPVDSFDVSAAIQTVSDLLRSSD